MNIVQDTPVAPVQPQIELTGLWQKLKSGTRSTHGRLDERVMAGRPFESRERYAMFVLAQHDFHCQVSPLFHNADLARHLPDLADRDRLAAIRQDLGDLGVAIPVEGVTGRDYLLDIPTALGWLYVAEGSNLGAAFLLKAARALDLDETFGARHLAGHPDGRGLRWRSFTTALDAIGLHEAEEDRVVEGANQAFASVRTFIEQRLI